MRLITSGKPIPTRAKRTKKAVSVDNTKVIITKNTNMGGVPRKQKMLKEHLARVIYHQVY